MGFIQDYRFGSITVDGTTYRDDIKIVRFEVVPGWWRSRGHAFDAPDMPDILAATPDLLVCGIGTSALVRIADGLTRTLRRRGITLHALPTPDAVRLFNELHARGMDVAGAFHLTC